jgi:hypothetical protein
MSRELQWPRQLRASRFGQHCEQGNARPSQMSEYRFGTAGVTARGKLQYAREAMGLRNPSENNATYT